MEKITKEELMKKLELTEAELKIVEGGYDNEQMNNCLKRKNELSKKCSDDYEVYKDYQKLYKCESAVLRDYAHCLGVLN